LTDLPSALGLARSLAIYYGRPWRIAAMARFYRRFLAPGDLAFDVGAHVGNRSLAMAWAGARVVALEPQALFHRFLCRVMPAAVTVLPFAAGPAEDSGVLAVSRRYPTVSSLAPGFPGKVGRTDRFRRVAWDTAQLVEVTTLDALIRTRGMPAFVKIDVEGYEADVLAGLGQPVPAIAFECLPQAFDVARASVDRLQAIGRYAFNFIRGEGHDFELTEWQDGQSVLGALEETMRDGRPGDVYAELVQSPRTSARGSGSHGWAESTGSGAGGT
jgi:FkbM family methyltransferase